MFSVKKEKNNRNAVELLLIMSEHRKHSRISVMQMFHELKQQFPIVPDQVVSDCILKVKEFIIDIFIYD